MLRIPRLPDVPAPDALQLLYGGAASGADAGIGRRTGDEHPASRAPYHAPTLIRHIARMPIGSGLYIGFVHAEIGADGDGGEDRRRRGEEGEEGTMHREEERKTEENIYREEE